MRRNLSSGIKTDMQAWLWIGVETSDQVNEVVKCRNPIFRVMLVDQCFLRIAIVRCFPFVQKCQPLRFVEILSLPQSFLESLKILKVPKGSSRVFRFSKSSLEFLRLPQSSLNLVKDSHGSSGLLRVPQLSLEFFSVLQPSLTTACNSI